MHFLALVFIPFTEEPTREMVEKLIDPVEQKSFPYRKVYLSSEARDVMSEVYAVAPGSTEQLAAAMAELNAGGIDEKGLYSLNSFNPHDHYDSWCIGGRFEGEVQGIISNDLSDVDEFADESFITNICPVKELPISLLPQAIVTPDGLWYDRGDDAESREQSWMDEYHGLCEKYADCLAVGVDCQG